MHLFDSDEDDDGHDSNEDETHEIFLCEEFLGALNKLMPYHSNLISQVDKLDVLLLSNAEWSSSWIGQINRSNEHVVHNGPDDAQERANHDDCGSNRDREGSVGSTCGEYLMKEGHLFNL